MFHPSHLRVLCAALVFGLPAYSLAAVTCVENKTTGRFEAPEGVSAANEFCAARASENISASFRDTKARAQNSGTRVYGGVFVTNASGQASSYESNSLLAGAPAGEPAGASLALKKNESSLDTWEILEADGTLQNTLARWAKAASWEVHWNDVPEVKNPGYVKLRGRDFLDAADFVLSKAKLAANSAGIKLAVTAYPNRVLVISKESQK